jgi:hypothetical protein
MQNRVNASHVGEVIASFDDMLLAWPRFVFHRWPSRQCRNVFRGALQTHRVSSSQIENLASGFAGHGSEEEGRYNVTDVDEVPELLAISENADALTVCGGSEKKIKDSIALFLRGLKGTIRI